MNPRALRRWLAVWGTLALLGIGAAVSDERAAAPFIVVGAVGALVFGLHRLGRSGPDEPFETG